jgi:G:T-mismatch repair DNA endonuclease (very short patch repair protein)
VRRFLHAKGLRYTLHGARLPGSPDLVLPSREDMTATGKPFAATAVKLMLT